MADQGFVRKFCPVMTRERPTMCAGERCDWWHKGGEQCVVHRIAETLQSIDSELEFQRTGMF